MISDGRPYVRIPYEGIDTPYCFALGLAQHETEQVIEAHLESLGRRVERGVRLATLEQDDDAVRATLLSPDGTWTEPRFEWVVGCDGAHSTVRKSISQPFAGTTFREDFFLADLRLESQLPDDEMALCSSSHGMLGVLPLPGDRRVRVFGDLDPGHEAELDEAACRAMVKARTAGTADARDLAWCSLFRIHTRMVERYRRGRVFLCGDAAHIHSPAGGHGMNTGVQDAYNLAWKLALVTRKKAHESLLDSYDAERRPVAKTLLAETDAETRMGLWRSSIARDAMGLLFKLVGTLPPVRRRILAAQMEIALSYADSPIVGEKRGSLLGANVVHDDASEKPSLGDFRSFSHAAGPGARVPDAAIEHGPARSMYELLRGPGHTVLLFDGRAPTEAGYRGLASAAGRIRDRFGDSVRVHVIAAVAERPRALDWAGSLLLDPQLAIHARYGAGAECLYAIRPDGYVAFRSQPADADAAIAHLAGYLA
jgi:2-polyprenyl-6-methoxyphenol hydroxylase-like FAD-dependent oxidoreductase